MQCHQCATLRQLPKVLIEDTTTIPDGIGTRLAADVIERASQKILIVRDELTQFIRGTIIPNQTADTLRQALLNLTLDIIPESGTVIRVDGATSFQALARESATNNSLLCKLKIKIEIGRLINKNKNPVAENAVKEVLKEILRYTTSKRPITTTELHIVLKNVNSRIRSNGLSPTEMMFKRDMLSNENIQVNEEDVKKDKEINRKKGHITSQKSKARYKVKTPQQSFEIGQLVFLRNAMDKNTPRELFIIEEFVESEDTAYYLIRKLQNTLNSRLYKVLPDEIIPAPVPATTDSRPKRHAAQEARKKIAATVNTVYQVKKKSKHGWLTEDQNSEDDAPYPQIDYPELPSTPNSNTSSSTLSPTPNTSHSEPQDSLPCSSDEDEYNWDSSPEQYRLQEEPPIEQQHQKNPPLPINTRPRLPGTSETLVTRSNAFRRPNLPPPAPRKSRKSRIPQPTSPTQVVTTSVNDVSIAVSKINTMIFSSNSRPRRSTPQPQNYRLFHSRGRSEEEDTGQEREEEETQKGPRKHRAATLPKGQVPARHSTNE